MGGLGKGYLGSRGHQGEVGLFVQFLAKIIKIKNEVTTKICLLGIFGGGGWVEGGGTKLSI